ncbi:sidestep protein, putative, partial [Ixodes scapularis]
GKVALPCDISPPSPEDSVTLVLWYKDESLAPIYTLDSGGVTWPGPPIITAGLGSACPLQHGERAGFLQIDPVEEQDAGEYRCRVDFRKGRSINTVINLKVIGKIQERIVKQALKEISLRLTLTANVGASAKGAFKNQLPSRAGAFHTILNSQFLVLTFKSERQKAQVCTQCWDKRLVDANFTVAGDGNVVRNRFHIHELKRSDFLTVLTCQAVNNNVTVAASRSITLDMNLIPLDVAIQPPKQALSADQEVELVCSSSGSRPPALLTWWKSGEQLVSTKEHQVQEGVSTSSSVILFTPRVEDNGLVLSCRAENPFIPGSAIEEGWKLDVFCKYGEVLE